MPLFACLFWLSACPGQGASEPLTVNRVAAVVNGEIVTLFDLEMASAAELMQMRINPRNPAHADRMRQVLQRNLERMIMDILIVQEAERLKLTADAAAVDAELEEMSKRSGMSREELFNAVKRQGMTEEHIRDRLRKRVLQQRLMSTMVGRKIVISKEDIAREFEAGGGRIMTDDLVELAVLVYPPQIRAEEVAGAIAAGQVPFAEAVRRVSMGPQRESGGLLPPRKHNELAPVLQEAVATLKPGEISKLFEMDGAQTQIQLIGRKTGEEIRSFAEAAPVIEERLREQKLQERYKEYTDQLRGTALVDIRL
jgi:peptidyl-prolyl cis-trans isomerase SurA